MPLPAGMEVEPTPVSAVRLTRSWHFDARAARTSCEGVGGLVTLLGLGATTAPPAPFSNDSSVHVPDRGFMREMTSSKFSAGLAGEIKVGPQDRGNRRLRGRLGGDISENLETVRDPVAPDSWLRRAP